MQKTAAARQILEGRFGGAAFVAKLPLYEKYFVLARVADDAGRKNAAYKMGVYAAVECVLEGHSPLGFLQGYGLKTEDSRLARGLAIRICERQGNIKMKETIMDSPGTDIGEAVLRAASCNYAAAFVKRRVREAEFESGRKYILNDLQRNAIGPQKKILNNVELAKYAENMMDQVMLKPENGN